VRYTASSGTADSVTLEDKKLRSEAHLGAAHSNKSRKAGVMNAVPGVPDTHLRAGVAVDN